MSEALRPPSTEDITAQPWQDVARQAEHPSYTHISTKFSQKAAELEQAGDSTGASVYRFLNHIVFIHLDPDNKDQPLRPAWMSPTGRSAAIEDFDEQARDTIEKLIQSTEVPLLRARFADMVWLLRKNYKMAELAATEYLAAFKQLDDSDNWAYEFACLKRGIALARMLGAKNKLFLDYVSFIESRLSSLETTCTDSLGTRLLDLLFEYRSGEPVVSARIAETIGDRLEPTGSSFLARDYYDIAAKFHRANGDMANVQRLGIKKGESLVRQAEACIGKEGQGYFTATHHLAIAIECFRQSGADDAKIQSLHKQLIEWQAKTSGEMKSFSHEVDTSNIVAAARDSVKGKALPQAIFAMAIGHPVINADELRKRVMGYMNDFPLTHLFSAAFMAGDGRVMAHKPSALTTDEETREKAIEAEMFHQAANIDWPLRAQAYINTCREQITEEHHPTLQELQFLVLHNPFIPEGHEPIFLRGILAGFRGEFDIVPHFLVPQIEESIRHILRSAGHVTSKLDAKLIQEQRLLGTLLGLPETIEILGKDHVFELRGILCEKFGYDLRNRLAHGFVSYSDCWGADVLNLWWLVIRLLSIPAARKAKEDAAAKEKKEGES
ncbi:MAG: hypothetical protein DME99_01735 [Verrucomicrobia bacterium]|nr:MAG: hypothetical protein DME99_01735 [Verrucomicrobiota bacterium]